MRKLFFFLNLSHFCTDSEGGVFAKFKIFQSSKDFFVVDQHSAQEMSSKKDYKQNTLVTMLVTITPTLVATTNAPASSPITCNWESLHNARVNVK